jgi:hypothetical protein
MGINWRRGALRLWTVASVMWCALVVIVSSEQLNVAWPFASLQIVHVKFSDTETWDYPAVWGVARIEAGAYCVLVEARRQKVPAKEMQIYHDRLTACHDDLAKAEDSAAGR